MTLTIRHRLTTAIVFGAALTLGACDPGDSPEDTQGDAIPEVQTNESEDFLYPEGIQEDEALEGRMEDGALGGTPSDRPEPIPESAPLPDDSDGLPDSYEDDRQGTMGGGSIDDGVEDQETLIPEGTAHDPVTDGTSDMFYY